MNNGTSTAIDGPPRALRVLIVDDLADSADSFATLVRSWGHAAEIAYGGPQALQVAASFLPDIVFLDMLMPTMNGFAVARAIKERSDLGRPELVAITGYAKLDRQQLQEVGIREVLIKPVELEPLQQWLAMRAATKREK